MAKQEKKQPNKGNVRKVKHLRYEYWDEEADPIRPGKTRPLLKTARAGDVIEIPREEDLRRGEHHGAFYTDADLNVNAALPGEVPIAQRSEAQLVAWLKDAKPSVSKTVEAAGGDPTVAQRILNAEAAATDGDPRQGVIDGLAAVIEAS